MFFFFFFFKHKTAYEMRISDWSSDVCSSDLQQGPGCLEPLGVLVEHRIDDVHERLIAVEHAVTSGEQVSLEPALALMLAEHLPDATRAGQVLVQRREPGGPLLVRRRVHRGSAAVGRRLVRPEDHDRARGADSEEPRGGSEWSRTCESQWL